MIEQRNYLIQLWQCNDGTVWADCNQWTDGMTLLELIDHLRQQE